MCFVVHRIIVMENKLLFQGCKAVPQANTSGALRCHPWGVDWEE